MLDGGHFEHMVSYTDHDSYWANMMREYPQHPLAGHTDRWKHSFGATLYGNFGLIVKSFLWGQLCK